MEDGKPPVATVYQFNPPPLETVAVSGVGVAPLQ